MPSHQYLGERIFRGDLKKIRFAKPKVNCCGGSGSCKVTLPVSNIKVRGGFSFEGYDGKTKYKVPYSVSGKEALTASFEIEPTGGDRFTYSEDSLKFNVKKGKMKYDLAPSPQNTDYFKSPQTKSYMRKKFRQLKGFPKKGRRQAQQKFVEDFVKTKGNRDLVIKWYTQAYMKYHKEDLLHTRHMRSRNLDKNWAAALSYIVGESGSLYRDDIDEIIKKSVLEKVVREKAVAAIDKDVQEALLPYDSHYQKLPSLQEIVTGKAPVGRPAYEKYQTYQDKLRRTGYSRQSSSYTFGYEGCVGDYGFPQSKLPYAPPKSCFKSYDAAIQVSIEDLNRILAELHSLGYFKLCSEFSKKGKCTADKTLVNPPLLRAENGLLKLVATDIRNNIYVKDTSTDLLVNFPRTAPYKDLLGKNDIVFKKNEEFGFSDGVVIGTSAVATGGAAFLIWLGARFLERGVHDYKAGDIKVSMREKLNEYLQEAPLVIKELQASKDGKTVTIFSDQKENLKNRPSDLRSDLPAEERRLCREGLMRKVESPSQKKTSYGDEREVR